MAAKIQKPYHTFDIAKFPESFNKVMTERQVTAAKLKKLDEKLDEMIQTLAGKIRVPVKIDSGEKTKTGNVKWINCPSGDKVFLPEPSFGTKIAVGFQYVNEGEVSLSSYTPTAKSAKDKSENEVLS